MTGSSKNKALSAVWIPDYDCAVCNNITHAIVYSLLLLLEYSQFI